MKTWMPSILQDDGMLPMCEAPSYAKFVTQYVRLADHEQAIAEKDREYAQLKEAYDAKVAGVPLGPIVGVQTIVNQQLAYNQLMAQAVRFADGCGIRSDSVGLAASLFLASLAVQQWRKGQGR